MLHEVLSRSLVNTCQVPTCFALCFTQLEREREREDFCGWLRFLFFWGGEGVNKQSQSFPVLEISLFVA